jgi:hypothetical protein
MTRRVCAGVLTSWLLCPFCRNGTWRSGKRLIQADPCAAHIDFEPLPFLFRTASCSLKHPATIIHQRSRQVLGGASTRNIYKRGYALSNLTSPSSTQSFIPSNAGRIHTFRPSSTNDTAFLTTSLIPFSSSSPGRVPSAADMMRSHSS